MPATEKRSRTLTMAGVLLLTAWSGAAAVALGVGLLHVALVFTPLGWAVAEPQSRHPAPLAAAFVSAAPWLILVLMPISVLGLVGAFGLLRRQRWGQRLLFLAHGLAALPWLLWMAAELWSLVQLIGRTGLQDSVVREQLLLGAFFLVPLALLLLPIWVLRRDGIKGDLR